MNRLIRVLLATIVLCWCSTIVCSADSWRIDAKAAPLSSAASKNHLITVNYTSSCGIDVSTLGDDDVFVSRRRLLQPSDTDEQLAFASLVEVMPQVNELSAMATYVLERPEAGWHSWQAHGLAINILPNSVSDLEGSPANAQVVGTLEIALTNDLPLPIIATLVREPQIHDLLQAFVDIDIRFSSSDAPLTPQLFEQRSVSVTTWREILTPIPLSLTIDSKNAQIAEASYRVMRPEGGWGGRPLSVYAHVLPAPHAAQLAGLIRIPEAQALTMTLQTGDAIRLTDWKPYEIRVIYAKTGALLDLKSLGDDDLRVEQLARIGPGLMISPVTFVSAASFEDRVVATYQVPLPDADDGWASWKRLTPVVRLQSYAVRDLLGQSLPGQQLGRIPLSPQLLPQRQQLVFEDWVNDLSKQLGLDKTPSKEEDSDKDGASDLTEMTFGTDPNDSTESNPITLSAVKIGDQSYLRLSFTSRFESFGTYFEIEGSKDGMTWERATHLFERVLSEQNETALIERLTLRSKGPISTLDYQWFRLRLVTQ